MLEKTKEKVLKLSKNQKVAIAITVGAFVLGYKCGARNEAMTMNRGLTRILENDPGLQDAFIRSATEVIFKKIK